MSDKSREWWLSDLSVVTLFEGGSVETRLATSYVDDSRQIGGKHIPVIEKSAFDELKEECERLKNYVIAGHEQIQQEKDAEIARLRAAVLECESIMLRSSVFPGDILKFRDIIRGIPTSNESGGKKNETV